MTAMRKIARKRPRKSTSVGPKVIVGAAVLLMAVLWTFGMAIMSIELTEHPQPPRQLFTDRPPLIQLWPDDRQNQDLPLRDCLPSDNTECLERVASDSSPYRIGIIRAPGTFGRGIESFVSAYINLQKSKNREVEATSHAVVNHSFTKIVRVAVIPVYLEALDLAMDAAENVLDIQLEDILTISRLLVRWHCRISFVARDTALFTLTLDPTLAFPTRAESRLADFLGYEMADDDGKDNSVQADPMANEALRRIDACRDILTRLGISAKELEEATDAIIQEENEAEECGSMMLESDNRMVTLVGHLLDEDPESSSTVCQLYPESTLCSKVDR